MPIASHSPETGGGFETPFATAGKMQIIAPDYPVPPPATLAGSGTWSSGLMYSNGYQVLTVAVNMNQGGTLTITRYVDILGTIARPTTGSPFTIVSGTTLIVDVGTDDLPWVTFNLSVTNGSGSAATISAFAVLMCAD
jgi:hypothetical protein